ncbi:hypothetical protein [Candidatus Mesenet endosymbiont of Agriotes lineatus]|uniref:hypothetical protein n=1 Tax=Candidatus Mesenet endosymbiont of Agriotes lineatus TaxID=3077948 RepID=UPI0030D34623
MPNNKPVDFFDKSFEEQIRIIIKTGDLKLLQAFIGVRNSTVLLQYCASFLITKRNIMQAQYQAEISVFGTLIKHYCEKMSEGKILLKNITQNIGVMFKDYVSQGLNILLQDQMVLPASKNKFLVDSESSHLKAYVQDTNVGALCSLSKDQVTQVYNSFIEKSNIEASLQSWLSEGKPAEIVETLREEGKKLKEKSVHDKAELKKNEGLLNEIKNNSFLNNWHKNLVYEVLKEALEDSNHILHKKVQDQYEIKNELDDFSKNIIRKKLKILWNRELVSRTLNQIIKGKNVKDEECKKSAIEELLRLDLESEDIMNEVEQKFKELKEELKKKSIKLDNVSANNSNDSPLVSIDEVREYIINNFSLSLLLKEEKGMLKEMLECAVKENKSGAVLLLICNQADYKKCNLEKEEDKKLLLELVPEGMAFLEIKHLYEGILKTNNLPKILGLPVLSLEEIKTIFSDESIMSKVVECILTQEKKLEIIIPKDKLDELDEYCTKMKWKKKEKMLERNKTGLSENDLKELEKYYEKVREEKMQKIKASLVNKNIEQILKTLETDYPLSMRFYYALKTKKSKLKKVEDTSKIVKELELSLQQSVATASPEPFFKELQEIKKNENRFSKSLFEELYELGKDTPSNAVSFKTLIDNISSSNEEYIAKKQGGGAVKSSTIDVFEKNINCSSTILDLRDELKKSNDRNQSIATQLTSAEAKAEEERVRAEEERVRAEEAEAKAEEERVRVEEAKAENKAATLVSEETDRREIFLKSTREFFIAQFKLVELYKGLKDKCQNLVHEYVKLRKELTDCEIIVDRIAQNPEEMSKEDIFERKLSLINEFEKLNKKIAKLDEEFAQEKPIFENEKIEEFKRDALEKVAQAKKKAEELKHMLQQEMEELQRLEEEKLQMQVEEISDSNFNIVDLEQPCSSNKFRAIFQ